MDMETTEAQEELIKQYVASLTEQEKLVFAIAQDHLGSSFDVVRSIGFIEWRKKTNR
jgi:hypothetical protein